MNCKILTYWKTQEWWSINLFFSHYLGLNLILKHQCSFWGINLIGLNGLETNLFAFCFSEYFFQNLIPLNIGLSQKLENLFLKAFLRHFLRYKNWPIYFSPKSTSSYLFLFYHFCLIMEKKQWNLLFYLPFNVTTDHPWNLSQDYIYWILDSNYAS